MRHANHTTESSETLGHVWSGHPVTFALLTERDHQYAAYYDANRSITVAGRRLGEETWVIVRPEGVPVPRGRMSNVTEWDSHNYLTLALDRDGFLHLSGNMHNDPLVYYRSTRPLDVSSLERLDRMTGERENNTTYPVFFKNAGGDLLFRYRDGFSGSGCDLYNVYDSIAQSWSPLIVTPLLDGEGKRNAYALPPRLGPDGRFHLVWMWRDTPDAATNHTLSYARSADLKNWETSGGKVIQLPITLATGEVIDPAEVHEGLINMTFNLGFDGRNQPVVVYHRYDGLGKSQCYAARPLGITGNWHLRQISAWDFRWQFGGCGSLHADILLGSPRARGKEFLTVDYLTEAEGAGRWLLQAENLEPLEWRPASSGNLPENLLLPQRQGMTVQTVVSRHDGKRWVLRWETLPRNLDKPREKIPPATELRLYEFPDTETSNATLTGS